MAKVSNPTATIDTLVVTGVKKGDKITLDYAGNGNVYSSDTVLSKEINGKQVSGQQFIFNVTGPTCTKGGVSEHVQAFGWVTKSPSDEILLGRTKYYAAVKDPNSHTGKIDIKEIPVDNNGIPMPPKGIITGAFKGNPIHNLSGGDTSGVYWDRKQENINSDGTISIVNLPKGIIRVIGRYWQAGKKYKVKIMPTNNMPSKGLAITVIKPGRLGNEYPRARDVFKHLVNMDSLIITNAGKYGIPPQILKGQIDKESAKKDFGGDVGNGFAPSYRFEPYDKDPYENIWFKGWAGKYYFPSIDSVNLSNIPHHYYLNRDYYRHVKTVWEIVKTNSQLITKTGGTIYGKRTATGRMDYGKYISIQKIYNSFYNNVEQDTNLTKSQIADSANTLMSGYLQDKWEGGMKNNVAQTRAASSYGLLQPMYTTALEKGYPKGMRPEDINLTKSFHYFVRNQAKLITDEVGKKNNNWSKAFDKTIRDVVLASWNDDSNYPNDVLRLSKKFDPK